MKRIIFSLFLIIPFALYGQKYSNEFLAIGAGARAHGMGQTGVVLSTDAYSPYWNPAGMSGIESDLQAAFMHAEWFAGVGNYDYFSIVKPLHNEKKDVKRAVGFSMVRFGVDDIPNTLSLYNDDGTVNYDNIVPFSSADYAFMLSYAQSLWAGGAGELYLGGNAKIIYRTIGPFAKARGFGVDLGLQFHTERFSFGLMARDASNTFNAWSFNFTDEEKQILALTDNDIPISSLEVTRPTFILGSAFKDRWGKVGLATELNLRMTTDGQRNTLISGGVSIDPAFGLEVDYNEVVYLRGGLNNFQRELDIDQNENLTMAPTLGIGVEFFAIKIDYAFTDISNTSQQTYSHVVSLLVDLDFDYLRKAARNTR